MKLEVPLPPLPLPGRRCQEGHDRLQRRQQPPSVCLALARFLARRWAARSSSSLPLALKVALHIDVAQCAAVTV